MRNYDKVRSSRFSVAIYVLLLSLAILLSGCSGGGSGSSGIGGVTVTGTASGTVIVAIDQNNKEVARAAAVGIPKTFAVNLPVGGTYRFYLIEDQDTINETIFPLYQGTTNNFSITSSATIDLGFVDTTTGVAIPAKNPLLISGVSSAGEIKSFPETLVSATPPTGASLISLVNSGLNYLSQGSILKAKAYFKAAVENYPNDSSNDGDTARAFYAFTRAVVVNLYSDGNTGDLNSAGDILDRMGCSPGGRGLYKLLSARGPLPMVSPKTAPSSFPTGAELQAFLYNVIKPELEGALANLDAVSSSFNRTWTEPVSGNAFISDYGDILYAKAWIKGAIATILIQYAYNLNANIAAQLNTEPRETQVFLVNNPSFLTRASGYSPLLSTAKTYLSEAADNYTAGINIIQTHTRAYLIQVGDMTAQDIADEKTAIANWKASLSGPHIVANGRDKTTGTADDVIFNLTPFFLGINLRDLLPPFIGGNKAVLSFPDPTMGGVIVQGVNMNESAKNFGIPHIPAVLY